MCLALPSVGLSPSVNPQIVHHVQIPLSAPNSPIGSPARTASLKKAVEVCEIHWQEILARRMAPNAEEALSRETFKGKSFKDACAILKNPAMIASTLTLLNKIGHKTIHPQLSEAVSSEPTPTKSTKAFLSAFLTTEHPFDTLDMLQPKEQEFLQSANEMIDSYEHLLKLIQSKEKSRGKISESLTKFRLNQQSYNEKFVERQKEHRERMTSGMVLTYLKMEIRINELSKTTPTRNQQRAIDSLRDSQKLIRDRIIAFAGSRGLERLNQHLEALMMEKWAQKYDLLRNESLEIDYEIATNPSFKFTFDPNSTALTEVYEKTLAAVQATPPNLDYLIQFILELRMQFIALFSHNKKLAAKVWEEITSERIREEVSQFSDPMRFLSAFSYFVDFFQRLESYAHDKETALWKATIFKQIQGGRNPYNLLPEIFQIFQLKLFQIRTERQNAILSINRGYWKAEAVKHFKEYFQSSLSLLEMQLDITEKHIEEWLKVGKSSRLSKEMLYSEHNAGHFLVSTLLNLLQSPKKTSKKECPETLLLDRSSLNAMRSELHNIKIHAIGLKIFEHTVKDSHGTVPPADLNKLHQKLTLFFKETPTEIHELPEIVSTAAKQTLSHQGINLSKEAQQVISGTVRTSLAPGHRIYQIVSNRITHTIKHFLSKGIFPDDIIEHHAYQPLASLHPFCTKLLVIASFNLEVHGERYSQLISAPGYKQLFRSLNKPRSFNPNHLEDIFLSEFATLKNLHGYLSKLSQLATSLTIIRLQVWLSNEVLWKSHAEMPQTQYFVEDELESIINTDDFKNLLRSAESTHVEIQHAMESLLDKVLEDKKITLEAAQLKKTKALFSRASLLHNPSYYDLHSKVVSITTTMQHPELFGEMRMNTILKLFKKELQEISIRLNESIKRARASIGEYLDAPPIASAEVLMSQLKPISAISNPLKMRLIGFRKHI